jgi:hypothetical protein
LSNLEKSEISVKYILSLESKLISALLFYIVLVTGKYLQLILMFIGSARIQTKNGAPERCFIWGGFGLTFSCLYRHLAVKACPERKSNKKQSSLFAHNIGY